MTFVFFVAFVVSGYPVVTNKGIAGMTNSALATGNRATMISVARSFDELNNMGCPFD